LQIDNRGWDKWFEKVYGGTKLSRALVQFGEKIKQTFEFIKQPFSRLPQIKRDASDSQNGLNKNRIRNFYETKKVRKDDGISKIRSITVSWAKQFISDISEIKQNCCIAVI